MTLRVRLFASFRQQVGSSAVDIELGAGRRVRDLLAALCQAYPSLGPALERAMVAVNLEYVGPNFQLGPGDEVALIPPVSGGAA